MGKLRLFYILFKYVCFLVGFSGVGLGVFIEVGFGIEVGDWIFMVLGVGIDVEGVGDVVM